MTKNKLTTRQQKLANLLIETKTKAKVRRRKSKADGSYEFYEVVRDTSPIDFRIDEGEFVFKLHEKTPDAPLSPMYINLRNLPENLLTEIGKAIASIKFNETADYCTGIPKAADPIADKFSKASKIPLIHIFAKDDNPAGRRIIPLEGAPKGKGKKLLIIDDLITKADSKFEAIKIAEELGYKVVGVAVLVDRQQGGRKQLADAGYTLYSAMELHPMLDYLLDSKKISQKRYTQVQEYLAGASQTTKLTKLPGLIDTHVHLREPGSEHKEDLETGTKAAIAGGYTFIIDMPNNPTPITTSKALNDKIKRAKGRIYTDLGFHFGGSEEGSNYFENVKDKVFGLKVYMNHTTGPLLIEDPRELDLIFSKWPKEKVLMVHAEAETLEKAIKLAKKHGNKLHVCHVSLKMQIEMIKKAKTQGLPITCEVGMHHLYLTEKVVKKLGNYGRMRPPLTTKEDVDALWENIDSIDIIASDHAPHTKAEKEAKTVVNGVPGLETSLPLLLNAVNEGKLSLEKVIEMTSTKPREIFNIPEQKNTYVEVDLDEEYTISNTDMYTKCGWTPFDGMKVKGRVKRVVLRGKTVFENGKVVEKPLGKVTYPL